MATDFNYKGEIPQGLLERLKEFEGKSLPIDLKDQIELILGPEWRERPIIEIEEAIEHLNEIRKEEIVESTLNKNILEQLEDDYKNFLEGKSQETIETLQKKYGKDEVIRFIQQQTQLREQKIKESQKQTKIEIQEQNIPLSEAFETETEKKETIKTQPISSQTIAPPITTETATKQTTEETITTTSEFNEFMKNTDDIRKKIDEIKEIKKQLEDDVQKIAQRYSEELNEKLKDSNIVITTEELKTIEKDIVEGIINQEVYEIDDKIISEISKNHNINEHLVEEISKTELIKLTSESNKFIEIHEETLKIIESGEVMSDSLKFFEDNKTDLTNGKSAAEYTKLLGGFITVRPGGLKEIENEIIRQNPNISHSELKKRLTHLETLASSIGEKDLLKLLDRHEFFKSNLKGNIPLNIKQARSLDGFKDFYYQTPGIYGFLKQTRMQVFGIQNIFSGFYLRINNFFLGQHNQFLRLNKNERLLVFLKNSFNNLENGFKFEFWNGIRNIFTKSAESKLFLIGTSASGGWVSLLATGIKKIFGKIGDASKNTIRKLGFNLAIGTQDFLNNNLGLIGSALSGYIKKTEVKFKTILFILLAILIGIIFIGSGSVAKQTAMFAPIKDNFIKYVNAFEIDTDGDISCGDKPGYTDPGKPSYFYNTGTSKLPIYIFESGKGGARLSQSYDLEASAPTYAQKHVRSDLNGGTQNDRLDSRVLEAYEAMVDVARKSGQLSTPEDLKLTSGYRNIETQERLWKEGLQKYGTPEATRKYVAFPGCSPHHTGRAIDIIVDGSAGHPEDFSKQRLSKTFDWLSKNAANFGFYNYNAEPWHWNYNPVGK